MGQPYQLACGQRNVGVARLGIHLTLSVTNHPYRHEDEEDAPAPTTRRAPVDSWAAAFFTPEPGSIATSKPRSMSTDASTSPHDLDPDRLVGTLPELQAGVPSEDPVAATAPLLDTKCTEGAV